MFEKIVVTIMFLSIVILEGLAIQKNIDGKALALAMLTLGFIIRHLIAMKRR